MAKQGINVSSQCRELISEIKAGQYKPVYLLMGEEAYYPDLVCQAIIDNCIDEFSKDFNETICYGADVTADQVISAARQFPMMAAVECVEDESSGIAFLVARPLKALADIVASRGHDWTGCAPLEESLRIDRENLESLSSHDFNELDGVYKSRRARTFLDAVRKELGK